MSIYKDDGTLDTGAPLGAPTRQDLLAADFLTDAHGVSDTEARSSAARLNNELYTAYVMSRMNPEDFMSDGERRAAAGRIVKLITGGTEDYSGRLWNGGQGFKTGGEYLASVKKALVEGIETARSPEFKRWQEASEAERDEIAAADQSIASMVGEGAAQVGNAFDFGDAEPLSPEEMAFARASDPDAFKAANSRASVMWGQFTDADRERVNKKIREFRSGTLQRARTREAYEHKLKRDNAMLFLPDMVLALRSEEARSLAGELCRSPSSLPANWDARLRRLSPDEINQLAAIRALTRERVEGDWWNAIGDMGISAWNGGRELLGGLGLQGWKLIGLTHNALSDEKWDVGGALARQHALMRATAPELIATDHGAAGEFFCGLASAVPFIAGMASPLRGATYMACAGEMMSSMDAKAYAEGIDTESWDYNVRNAVAGGAYAYMLKAVPKLLGETGNVAAEMELRTAYVNSLMKGFLSLKGLKHLTANTASGATMMALQSTIASINESLHLGGSATEAASRAFAESFVGSLPDMAAFAAHGLVSRHAAASGGYMKMFTKEGAETRSKGIADVVRRSFASRTGYESTAEVERLRNAELSVKVSEMRRRWAQDGDKGLAELGMKPDEVAAAREYFEAERRWMGAAEKLKDLDARLDEGMPTEEFDPYAFAERNEAALRFDAESAAYGNAEGRFAGVLEEQRRKNIDEAGVVRDLAAVRDIWARGRAVDAGKVKEDGTPAETDAGAAALVKAGFSPKDAAAMSAAFAAERRGVYSPAAAEALRSIYTRSTQGRVDVTAALAATFGGRLRNVEGRTYLDLPMPDGKTGTLLVERADMSGMFYGEAGSDPELARQVEHATGGAVKADDWIKMDDAARRRVVENRGRELGDYDPLFMEGDFQVADPADPSLRISAGDAETVLGVIRLDPTADPGAGYHEAMHGFLRFCRETGFFDEADLKWLTDTYGKPQNAREQLDEESAADGFRQYLAKRMAGSITEEPPAWRKLFGLVGRLRHMREGRAATERLAMNAEEALYDALVAGRYQHIRDLEFAAPAAPKAEAPKGEAELAQTGAKPKEPAKATEGTEGAKETPPVASVPDVPVAPAVSAAPRVVSFEALTPTGGKKIKGHYEIVPLASLLHSNKPGYPMELQQRDRRANKGEEQTREDHIANFEAGYLLADPKTDSGAMVVARRPGPDGKPQLVVVSGNGRTMVLEELAKRHLYDRYRNRLKEWAAENGVENAVADADNPVLVRVVDDLGGATLKELADLSNTNAIQQMNEEEQARADADLVRSLDLAKLYRPNMDGSANMAAGASDEFFRAFVHATGDTSLLNSDGTFTEALRMRARRALLAIACGQGERGRDVVKKLVEDTDALGIDRQKDAAAAIAPHVAATESRPEYAIGPDVSRAFADYIDFRENRDTGKKWGTLENYLKQGDMLDPRSEIAEAVMRLLDDPKSAPVLAETVRLYADVAKGEADGLFGAARTRAEIWRDAAKAVDEKAAQERARNEAAFKPETRFSIRSEADGKKDEEKKNHLRPSGRYGVGSNTTGSVDGGSTSHTLTPESADPVKKFGDIISQDGVKSPAEFLTGLVHALGSTETNPDKTQYFDITHEDGKNLSLRVANHRATARQYTDHGNTADVKTSIVVKMSDKPFKPDRDVELTEHVYFSDRLTAEREAGIAHAVAEWIATGEWNGPAADQVNMSPRKRYSIGGIYTGAAADYANRSRQGGVDDGPSVKKIGTGEGSQVYGWGLYGSTVRGVAKGYAQADRDRKRGRRTTLKSDVLLDGKPIRDNADVRENHLGAIGILEDYGSVDAVLKNYEFFENHGKLRASERADYEWLKANRDRIALREVGDVPQHLYEQTFFTDRAPGDESHLLKWYDEISDANWDRVIAQAEKEGLRDKLKGAWWLRFNGDLEHFITDNGNSGDAIYESLSRLLGSPQAASEFLARAGIDGVKYPVDSYGGKTVKDGDEAGWNYVSFRDDNIRVDHKWTDGQQRYSITTLGKYNTDDLRDLAHRVKDGDSAAIADAGRRLAKILPKNAVLVPMPSRTGEPTTMRALADAIAANADGATVVDALRSNPHESSYERKKRGDEPEEVEMRRVAEIPKGREVYVVDNVIDTGATYHAAMRTIHAAHLLALADTDKTPAELRQTIAPTVKDPDVQIEKESADQRYSVFAGEKTATPRLLKPLVEAKAMLGDGEYTDAERREIYDKTGWWRGTDGKWRVELPNLKAKYFDADASIEFADADVILEKYGWNEYAAYWLRDLVTFPKGLKAGTYELGETLVFFDTEEQMKSASGGEDASAATFVRVEHGLFGPQVTCEIHVVDPMAEERERKGRQRLAQPTLDSLTHELQHVIQLREGFAFGGNTADAGGDRAYGAAAGEVEARNAARRNDSQNRTRPPWATEDVPARYQSVGYSGWEWTDADGWRPMAETAALSPSAVHPAAERSRYSVAGRGGAERLGLKGAAEAEAMEKAGADREEIWRKTGWWRGTDGKWRVEIPDVKRKRWDGDPEERHFMGGGEDFYRYRLTELIEDGDFLKAYPKARDIVVEFHKNMPANVGGNFNEATLTIKMPQKFHLTTDWAKEGLGDGKSAELNEAGRKTIVHELQHAIQRFEGFAKGGSPTEPVRPYALDGETGHALSVFGEAVGLDPTNDRHLLNIANWAQKITSDYTKGDVPQRIVESFEAAAKEAGKTPQEFRDEIERLYDSHTETPLGQYIRLEGEVEARNVKERLNMTPEARAAIPPWKTEDVAEASQIVRYSIVSLADRKVAILDRRDEIAKIDLNDKRSLHDYLVGKVGQELMDGFFVGDDLPDEYIHSRDAQGNKARIRKAKAKLATGLDEAAQSAAAPTTELAVHKQREGGKYYRRAFAFAVPSGFDGKFRAYTADMVSYMKDGTERLYDVVNIEDAPGISADLARSSFRWPSRIAPEGTSRIPAESGASTALTQQLTSQAQDLFGGGKRAVETVSARAPGEAPTLTAMADLSAETLSQLYERHLTGESATSAPEGTTDSIPHPSDEIKADPEAFARRSIAARLDSGFIDEKRNALVALVAERALRGGPRPDPIRTIARLGLEMRMGSVDAGRIIKEGEALAERLRGTIAEKAAKLGDAATAIAVIAREADIDRAISGGAEAGGRLLKAGEGKIKSILEREIDKVVRSFNAASLADVERDTGLDIAGELLANSPEKFDPKASAKRERGAGNGEQATGDAATGAATGDAPPDAAPRSDLEIANRERVRKQAEKRVKELLDKAKERAAKRKAKEDERRARAEERRAKAEELEQEAAVDAATAGGDGGMGGGDGSVSGAGALDAGPELSTFADFKTPEEFAAFFRVWAEERYKKEHGVTMLGKHEAGRLFPEFYRQAVVKELQDIADKLLAPKGARAAVNRWIGDIKPGAAPDTIERASADIFSFINRNAIREKRSTLIEKFRNEIRSMFSGKVFDDLKQDSDRKVTGWVEEAARYIYRVCDLSHKVVNGDKSALDREHERLRAILDRREKIYDDEGKNPADAPKVDMETRRALAKLQLLDKYGAMRRLMPGEILDLHESAMSYLRDEARKLEDAWNAARTAEKEISGALIDGIVGPNGGDRYRPEKGPWGWAEKLFDSMNGLIRLRLQHLVRFADSKKQSAAKDAINRVMVMLGDGEVAFNRLVASDRQALFTAVQSIFTNPSTKKVDRAAMRKWLESLTEPVPVELSRQISTQGFANSMPRGNLIQLLVSLEQKSYAEAVAANGRSGQADLIRNFETIGVDGRRERLLSREDILFVEWLRDFYARKREFLSPYTQRLTGLPVDSPDPLYCPVKIYRGDVARGLHVDDSAAWDPIGAVFSRRVQTNRDFDESASVLGMFFDRSAEAAKLVAWGERGAIIRSVFTNPAVQERIRRSFGGGELSKILKQLEQTFNGGESVKKTPGEIAAADKMMNWMTYLQLGFNPLSAMKQTTSFTVWANALPGGFRDLWRYMRDVDMATIRHLKESEEYKNRYGDQSASGGMDLATRMLNENPSDNPVAAFFKTSSMALLRKGDFLPGGWIAQGVFRDLLEKHMKEGMDPVAADKLAMTETFNMLEETQQSGRIYNTHELAREHGRLARMLVQFATSPLQQLQYETQALREWRDLSRFRPPTPDADFEKRYSAAKGRLLRAALINHILLPAALHAVTDIYRLAMGQDPEWEKDGWHTTLLRDIVLGQFSRVFFIGTLTTSTIDALSTGKVEFRNQQMLPIESSIGMAANAAKLVHDVGKGVFKGFSAKDFTEGFDAEKVRKDLERILRSTSVTRTPYDVIRRLTGNSDVDVKKR